MEEVGCRECPGPHGSLLYRIIGLFARASRALDSLPIQWNVRFAHIPLSEYTAPCIRLEFQSDTGLKLTLKAHNSRKLRSSFI